MACSVTARAARSGSTASICTCAAFLRNSSGPSKDSSMSRGIWTLCGGRSNLRSVEGTPWRVVESQQRISTRQLVDSDAEHILLEDLIEGSKPEIPEAPALAGLHFLLFSPFRYPPLPWGSRFGAKHEPSLWYGSDTLETALPAAAAYRLPRFEGAAP